MGSDGTASVSARTRIRPRYGETDQMGVIYHANYVVWFNEARDALLGSMGIDLPLLEQTGYRFPVTELSCKYVKSVRYGDEVVVHAAMRIESVARMRVDYEVFTGSGGALMARGSTVSVVTRPDGRLLLRWPAELEVLLQRVAGRAG